MAVEFLKRDNFPALAYQYSAPAQENLLPVVVFCGGYRSDMMGTKATYFEKQCQQRGQGYIRFDYSGHGSSDGIFREGTIGSWTEDALAIIDRVVEADRKVLLLGSSMGGWIALLMARARPKKIHAVIGVAAAPDFTEDIYNDLDDAQRKTLMNDGLLLLPNDYSDEPYEITRNFYEEGRNHLLLDKTHDVHFAIHLVQGKNDLDVSWKTALGIQKVYGEDHVFITFIDDGDHRLSRLQDLELIDDFIKKLSL